MSDSPLILAVWSRPEHSIGCAVRCLTDIEFTLPHGGLETVEGTRLSILLIQMAQVKEGDVERVHLSLQSLHPVDGTVEDCDVI